MTEKFFNDECHENAHKLAAASAALESAQAELTAARKAHEAAELAGGRAEIVESMHRLSECEMVSNALAKQRDTLAGILRDSLCENFHAAKRHSFEADMSRRAAGNAAAMPHITAALEAVKAAIQAFNEACGGSDLVAQFSANDERKILVSNLSADEVRPVPEFIFVGPRHLAPSGLADAERVLAALLP